MKAKQYWVLVIGIYKYIHPAFAPGWFCDSFFNKNLSFSNIEPSSLHFSVKCFTAAELGWFGG